MFPKKTVILFAAGWMLLALVALPAHASAIASHQNPSTVLIETFPIFENNLNVRQAHITWLASKEDVGMQATIVYVESVNGSSTRLLKIYETFQQSQTRAGMADSHEALDAILQDFRKITPEFRNETTVQLKTGNGKPGDLRISLLSALNGSARVRSLEDQYWQTRKTNELADFDHRAGRAIEMMKILQGSGYEITAAQEKFTEIITMRNDLATALNTRNNNGIEQAHKKIHTSSIGFAQTVRGLGMNVSLNTTMRQNIEQGSAIMKCAIMVNEDLKKLGLGNSSAERYVSAGTTQLADASAQLDNGNTDGAKATLFQFRSTVQSLRDSYRSILVKEDLPQTTAKGVLSVAQSLDVTAARIMVM